MPKNEINWKVLVFSLLFVFIIAFIGSLFTSGNVNSSWYLDNKPSFTPPGWIFGPVWTILYFLIALSFYFSWIKAKKEKKKLATIFGINLTANVLWSYLFFEIQNPILAFIDILIILSTIVLMMITTRKLDKKSFWLLLPYLIWVGFATLLNAAFL